MDKLKKWNVLVSYILSHVVFLNINVRNFSIKRKSTNQEGNILPEKESQDRTVFAFPCTLTKTGRSFDVNGKWNGSLKYKTMPEKQNRHCWSKRVDPYVYFVVDRMNILNGRYIHLT